MKKSKGIRTQQKIIEAAIACLTGYGLHQTTFQKIADECGVSQPLVMHYFSNRDDIFPKVWDYVYQKALEATSSRLQNRPNPSEKLSEYFQVSWTLFSQNEGLMKIYIQLFFLASFDENLKTTNTNVKRVAIKRLADIILEGQKMGEFNMTINPFHFAKLIHISLSGFLLNKISEHTEFEYPELLAEFTSYTLQTLKQGVGSTAR